MRVLKRKNPTGWEVEKVCTGENRGYGDGGCGALLAVEETDVHIFSDFGHLVDGDPRFFGFICPECGKCTGIPEEELPESVKNRAWDEFRKNMNP